MIAIKPAKNFRFINYVVHKGKDGSSPIFPILAGLFVAFAMLKWFS